MYIRQIIFYLFYTSTWMFRKCKSWTPSCRNIYVMLCTINSFEVIVLETKYCACFDNKIQNGFLTNFFLVPQILFPKKSIIWISKERDRDRWFVNSNRIKMIDPIIVSLIAIFFQWNKHVQFIRHGTWVSNSNLLSKKRTKENSTIKKGPNHGH